MKRKIWYWLPRILAVLSTVVTAFFALDVIGLDAEPWFIALRFIVHLGPSILILFATLVAWRRERLGGLLFIAIAIVAIIILEAEWPGGIAIFTILTLIGLLFICCHYFQQRRPGIKQVAE